MGLTGSKVSPINTPGKLIPTKKGIALTLDEWEALKQHMMSVDSVIKEQPTSYHPINKQPGYYNPADFN